jgi:hypothetical protein
LGNNPQKGVLARQSRQADSYDHGDLNPFPPFLVNFYIEERKEGVTGGDTSVTKAGKTDRTAQQTTGEDELFKKIQEVQEQRKKLIKLYEEIERIYRQTLAKCCHKIAFTFLVSVSKFYILNRKGTGLVCV